MRQTTLRGKPGDRRISAAIGVSPTTIGAWLRGDRFPQDLDRLLSLVRELKDEADRQRVDVTPDQSKLLDPDVWRRLFEEEANRRAKLAAVETEATNARRSLTAISTRITPLIVGSIPPRADSYQYRDVASRLSDRAAPGSTSMIASGLGGVGKTQLAADFARRVIADGPESLIVWVPAGSRASVVATYANAGSELEVARENMEPAAIAEQFLNWLETTKSRWLIVLDDLSDPRDITGLWPPNTEYGRTLVTTRRRDASLLSGRAFVDVDVFSPTESSTYLLRKLPTKLADDVQGVVTDLGRLPLALSHAAAYMADLGITCTTYRRRFADQRKRLTELFPDSAALFDGSNTTVATTWRMSIAAADTLAPRGFSAPVLQLASLLDSAGIPLAVLFSDPARQYVARMARSLDVDRVDERLHPVSESGLATLESIEHGISNLKRFSLVSASDQVVRVHSVLQRAVRDSFSKDDLDAGLEAAGDALSEILSWSKGDRALGTLVHANISALAGLHMAALRKGVPGIHPVFFQSARSLGESGLVVDAINELEQIKDQAYSSLGTKHRDTIRARRDLAFWNAKIRDADSSRRAMSRVLDDSEECLGEQDLDTLLARRYLAEIDAQSGDYTRSITELGEVWSALVESLGPLAEESLSARRLLDSWIGLSGDLARAISNSERLMDDLSRVFGNDHVETLAARRQIACWRGKAGDPSWAVDALSQLLDDTRCALGEGHPETLLVHRELEAWRRTSNGIARPEEKSSPRIRPADDFARLVARLEAELEPHDARLISARKQLAYWKNRDGDPVGATESNKELLAFLTDTRGRRHRDTLAVRHNLAASLGRAGKHSDAATEFAELSADLAVVDGPESSSALAARLNYSISILRSGDPAQAVVLLRDLVRRIRETTEDEDAARLAALAKRTLASALSASGDYLASASELRSLIAESSSTSTLDDRSITSARRALGLLLDELGNSSDAISEFSRISNDLERVLGAQHADTVSARLNLAYLRGRSGDFLGAVMDLRDVIHRLEMVHGEYHHEELISAKISLRYWQRRLKKVRSSSVNADRAI